MSLTMLKEMPFREFGPQIKNLTAQVRANKYILVNWKSEREAGDETYIIERSSADELHFIEIGRLHAAFTKGYSDDYQFSDFNVNRNVLYNYRLRIISGSSEIMSEIKTAMTTGTKTIRRLTPNPADGLMKLLVNDYSGPAAFRIFNSRSHEIFFKEQHVENLSTIIINFNRQPKGKYVLEIKTADEIITENFIIK